MTIKMKAIKVIKIFSILIAILCSCGCEKDDIVNRQTDDKGVVIAAPYLWKTSLHEKEPISNSHISNPVIYNDNILVPTTNGDKSRSLSLISSKDGKILWDWDGQFDEDSEYFDIPFHYQYENLLTYHYGASYCIDLDNGSTKWRHKRERSFGPRIDSFGQYYFTYANIINSEEFDVGIAFKGDIQTGIISEYLTPNFTYEHLDCKRGINHIAQVPNQKNLLVVDYCENLPDWIVQPFLGLYNTDTKQWIWDRVLIREPQSPNFTYYSPIIVNNKIYTWIVNTIVCHDLETGRQLWKKDFGGDFMFTGIIVEEGRVIGNCEDTYMYALNADTGAQLWKTPTAGTGSRMSYLNGVVYMVGGSGGGRLFAIEASSGKTLWKIDAGLLGEGYGARFRTNAVYVLPAKGNQPAKVIALSNMYAYCFEAER